MNVINKLTLRQMKLNKKRTLVTIIGIIISVAMIMAVSTVAYSYMDFMAREAMISEGYFHFEYENVFYGDCEEIVEEFDVERYSITKNLGDYIYSVDANGKISISDYENDTLNEENESYIKADALRLIAVDDNYFEQMSIKLKEGSFPENNGEILLSQNISENMPDKKIGDTIMIGDIAYTITGIIEGADFVSGNLAIPNVWIYPVYTPLTTQEIKKDELVNGFFYAGGVLSELTDDTLELQEELGKNVKQNEMVKTDEGSWYCDGTQVNYNYSVLRYLGMSGYGNIDEMFTTMRLILITIIVVGSISLIANGFIISISERSKYLGMLASVGATKKQKRNSVYFEGFLEGIIAIPIGILAGIGGIGITFKLLDPLIKNLSGNDISLEVVINLDVIVWTVVFSVLTIFLSAYIPARRASKITAIDAIRLTKDLKISKKEVKTMKLTGKIFGFEGDLALKNLKRNKKKYRVTVFSMFISLTLFISVYSFVFFLKKGYESEVGDVNYNISINDGYMKTGEDVKKQIYTIGNDAIKKFGIEEYFREIIPKFNDGYMELSNDKDYNYTEGYQEYISSGIYNDVSVKLICMSDEDLKRYLEDTNVSYKEFTADKNNMIIFDNEKFQGVSDGDRYSYEGPVFDNVKTLEFDYKRYEQEIEDGYQTEKLVETTKYSFNVLSNEEKITGMGKGRIYALITPEMMEELVEDEKAAWTINMWMKVDNPGEVEKYLSESFGENINLVVVENVAEYVEKINNSIILIEVFAYGFIVLMTLICVANIVNTISTSIALRKREFAMLKAVGMTQRAFGKMICYESAFYGIKGVLFGLPAGTVVMLLIRNSISDTMDIEYGLPWMGYVIAVLGIFVVIGLVMLYSANKIKKENVIDALKNENI